MARRIGSRHLLRRYEAEAAREAAREAAFGMVREVRFELACDIRPKTWWASLSLTRFGH